MPSKTKIRRLYLDKRRRMNPAEARALSRQIHARLLEIDAFQNATDVFCYVSSKDNEVDTLELMQSLFQQNRRVYAPKAERSGALLWAPIPSLDVLTPGRFGILEPAKASLPVYEPAANPVAIVPGIAFSPAGCRVGYGWGYFDRFLAKFPGPKIGLAYECQIVDSVSRDFYDVPMDYVVTERQTYRIRP